MGTGPSLVLLNTPVVFHLCIQISVCTMLTDEGIWGKESLPIVIIKSQHAEVEKG